MFADRYLLLIALLVLVFNWVNTTGEYLLGRTVAEAAARGGRRRPAGGLTPAVHRRFYAEFLLRVNVVGVVLQLFVVSPCSRSSACGWRCWCCR